MVSEGSHPLEEAKAAELQAVKVNINLQNLFSISNNITTNRHYDNAVAVVRFSSGLQQFTVIPVSS